MGRVEMCHQMVSLSDQKNLFIWISQMATGRFSTLADLYRAADPSSLVL
jgi:hypothetical protein